MKVIIDTDIGDDIDDAYAIYLSTKTEELDILGITTVYRNTKERTQIVKQLLHLLNKDIKVFSGENNPLNTKYTIEEFETIDPNGLPHIPQYYKEYGEFMEENMNAVDFILKSINDNPYEVTLVLIGPSTNAALAYKKSPETFRKLKRILMMGGSNNGFAEWNVRSDADAFDNILKSGVSVTLVPFDITKQIKFSLDEEVILNNENDKALSFIYKMLLKMHKDRPERITTLHDTLAIAELTNSFCEYKKRTVRVDLDNKKGTLIDDECGITVSIAYMFDKERFLEYLFKKLDICRG